MFIVRDKRNGKYIGKYYSGVDSPNDAKVFRSISGIKNSYVGKRIWFKEREDKPKRRGRFSRKELPEWAEIIELDLTQTFNLEE